LRQKYGCLSYCYAGRSTGTLPGVTIVFAGGPVNGFLCEWGRNCSKILRVNLSNQREIRRGGAEIVRGFRKNREKKGKIVCFFLTDR
jgi:hypothetical protein